MYSSRYVWNVSRNGWSAYQVAHTSKTATRHFLQLQNVLAYETLCCRVYEFFFSRITVIECVLVKCRYVEGLPKTYLQLNWQYTHRNKTISDRTRTAMKNIQTCKLNPKKKKNWNKWTKKKPNTKQKATASGAHLHVHLTALAMSQQCLNAQTHWESDALSDKSITFWT